MGNRRRRRSLIEREARSKKQRAASASLPEDPSVSDPEDPTVGEESPVAAAEQDDPDFEETDLVGADEEAASTLAPVEPVVTEAADEERSISNTLIGIMKSIFGASTPPPVQEEPPPPPPRQLPLVFPADQTSSFNSFDSQTDEDTARQVREALARMARGEDPFDE